MEKVKLLPLLLAACLCLSLAACGGTPAEADTPTAEPSAQTTTSADQTLETGETPEAETPAEKGFVPVNLPLTTEEEELSLWLRLSPFLMIYNISDLGETTFYTEMDKRTGVHVEVTSVPIFMAMEQFNIMMAGGDLPDMLDSFALLYPSGVDHAVDEGLIVDMNDFLSEWMPNYEYALSLNPRFIQDSTSAEGRLTHANTLMIEDEGVTVGMMIRQDWLDDVGLDLPETYDDYYEALTAFKVKLNKPGAMNMHFLGCTVNVTGGFETVGFYTEDEETLPFMNIQGTASFGPMNEGYRSYLETMARWFDEDLIFQDYASDTRQEMMDAGISNDEQGIFSINRDNMVKYQNAARLIDADATIAGAYDMRAYEGQEIHVKYPGQTIIYGVAISADCANIKLAARWLDYCYSEEGTILCNYGVEGEGLQYDGQGNPGYTDLVLHNEEMTSIACCAIYSKYGGAMLCYGRRNFGSYDDQMREMVDFWDNNSDYEYIYPAKAGLTTEESEEISAHMAEIRSYVTEMTNKFITGATPLNDEAWDKYVSVLKDLGVERLVEIKQDALDRYIALGKSLEG